MIEKTFVMIKPDGVERGLIGEVIKRFEQSGLKIIAMKMVWVDQKFAKKHYTEDITKRRGKMVRDLLIKLLVEGPVVAIVIEGIHAVEVTRKIIGDTEPRTAPPTTIRGDFAHHAYDYCNKKKVVVKNLIHAAANKKDANNEIKLWFDSKEMHSYKRTDEKHTR